MRTTARALALLLCALLCALAGLALLWGFSLLLGWPGTF
jgi:hypothetical protein